MYTVEEKLDLVMRYITAEDINAACELEKQIKEVLANKGSPEIVSFDETDVIADLLKEIGVPCNLLGYKVIIDAVLLCLHDGDYLQSITKRLYPDLAIIHNTTASRVERRIRHAIEAAFDKCDIATIKSMFGNRIDIRSGKVTNGEFIAACMYRVRRRLKAQSIEA